MCVDLLGFDLPKMQEGEPFPMKASTSNSRTSRWVDLDLKNRGKRERLDHVTFRLRGAVEVRKFCLIKARGIGSKYLMAFSEWLSQPLGWDSENYIFLVSGRGNRPSILTNLFVCFGIVGRALTRSWKKIESGEHSTGPGNRFCLTLLNTPKQDSRYHGGVEAMLKSWQAVRSMAW